MIAAEFPSYFIYWALADTSGRRFSLCFFFLLSSASIIVLGVSRYMPLHDVIYRYIPSR